MACNCKKKNSPVDPKEAFNVWLKLKSGQELTIGERDLLYFFHNQKLGTRFETYCKHCWDQIINNLNEYKWESPQD